jgi:hypothetical protein
VPFPVFRGLGSWSEQAKAKSKQWWKCLFRLHVLPLVWGPSTAHDVHFVDVMLRSG